MLQLEAWKDVKRIASFRLGQRAVSNDLSRKVATVNLCIALKALEDDKFKDLLAEVDWSSSLPEFKLAVAVLRDDIVGSVEAMKKVGKEGELLNEVSYYSWPLFRNFRLTKEFQEAFQEIYGRPFVELAEQAIDAEIKAPSEVEQTVPVELMDSEAEQSPPAT
jgi:hypothetical protein